MRIVQSIFLAAFIAASAPFMGIDSAARTDIARMSVSIPLHLIEDVERTAALMTPSFVTNAFVEIEKPAEVKTEAEELDASTRARLSCLSAVEKHSNTRNFPPDLLKAIALTESGFNSLAIGTPNKSYFAEDAVEAKKIVRKYGNNVAVGCAQMHRKWHRHHINDLLDPDTNVRLAADFLQKLRKRSDNWIEAVGAYHGGDQETRTAYVCRVRASMMAINADHRVLDTKCDRSVTRAGLKAARHHLADFPSNPLILASTR